MLKEQRQAFIRDEIKKNGFASVDNLVAQMDSSYSTVRRDIDELAEISKPNNVKDAGDRSNFLLY